MKELKNLQSSPPGTPEFHGMQKGGDAAGADSLRQRIDDLVGEISASQIDRGGIPRGVAREPIIWSRIVRFANTDFKADPKALVDVAKLLKGCAVPVILLEEPAFGDYVEIHELHKRSGQRVSEIFYGKILEYQPKLQLLLKWLCAPERCSNEEKSEAVRFLDMHSREIRVELDWEPQTNLDEKDDHYHPLFYTQTVAYRSIASPICRFVYDQIERFHNEELDLREALPIRICLRPNCGKFILPDKTRLRYCPGCSARFNREKKSGDEWKEYMWLHRLRLGNDPRAIRRKLKPPKQKKRLQELAAQTRWPKLAAAAKKIQKRLEPQPR